MGRAKQAMIDEESMGYVEPKKRLVGESQFPFQKYLQEDINRDGEIGICDYSGKKEHVLPLKNIFHKVYDAFEDIFESPDYLPFESGGDWDEYEGTGLHKEGAGYILPDNRKIMDVEEALEFAGFMPKSSDLFQDIADCITQNSWVVKDAFGGSEDERLRGLWDSFWNATIRDARNGIPYDQIYSKHESKLSYMKQCIASNLHSLSTTILKGTRLYRCVNYKNVPNPMLPENLWAPPVENASSQRMSCEGQSRLYASFDRETPIREAVGMDPGKHHCLGSFRLTANVVVLDFTNIPVPRILNVPDFFAYRFFYQFAKAITQKVGEEEKQKYVPTQLMRDIIEQGFDKAGILGIKYRSVKGDNTSNLVLFLDNDTCRHFLHLDSYEVDPV